MSKRPGSNARPSSKKKRGRSHARGRGRRPVHLWETDADLLRNVPALVGVDPHDSLVLVAWGEGEIKRYRALGALRVDLPTTTDEERLEAWAEHVLGLVLRVHRVIGVAPIVYTSDTFAPSGRPPAAAPMRAVTAAAGRMGLDLVHEFVVAADGWGSLADPDLPRGGRPLATIQPAEPVALRPRAAAEVAPASPAAQDAFRTRYHEWWHRADGPGGVLHGVRLAEEGSAFGLVDAAMERYRWGRDTAELVELIERMLDPHDGSTDDPCPCRALLFALAERQGIENLVLVQFGWGRAFAERLWRSIEAEDPDGEAGDDLVRAIGGGAIRRPDPRRLDRAIEVLLETAAYVPETDRAPVDGMLAWLLWARGGASAGAEHALRALRLHPGRDLPSIVLLKAQRGELPQWAFRKNPAKADPFEQLLASA